MLYTQYLQRQSHHRYDNCGKEEIINFQGTYENKKTVIKTMLASSWLCIYNRICQWYGPRPRAVDNNCAIRAENTTSSRRLVATTHRASRDADSQSFRTRSTCQNGGIWTILHTNESVVDGNNSSPSCREDPELMNSQTSRFEAIHNDHVEIGPVTGIEVSDLAQIFVIEVKYTTTRKFEAPGAHITRN